MRPSGCSQGAATVRRPSEPKSGDARPADGAGGPIPRFFPELELELELVGVQNAHYHSLSRAVVTLIDTKAGVEKVVTVKFVSFRFAYVIGAPGRPGWGEFVKDSGIFEGDRIDLYVGRRGNGERCLVFFNNKVTGVRDGYASPSETILPPRRRPAPACSSASIAKDAQG
ncbi:hypothetical protein ZWY2020_000807 [Hordeum vulgare]|nr:hypothetical protein ZWY2020_000807 [Hordeum vulgare]